MATWQGQSGIAKIGGVSATRRVFLCWVCPHDGDGVAQNEADHFEKCPVCSQRFDMRDLAQLAWMCSMAARLKLWKDRHHRHAKDLSTEGARGSLMVALRGEEPTDVNRSHHPDPAEVQTHPAFS